MKVTAFDIGSSALKRCVFDLAQASPSLLDKESIPCPLIRGSGQQVEHSLSASEAALHQLLESVTTERISFTSAMHGLVFLDKHNRPMGDAISWADGRSAEQAREIRTKDPTAHQRTGTPIHTMAWPSKLLWLKETEPEKWEKLGRLRDLKSHLLSQVIGREVPLDLSSASATGLWNQAQRCWDQALLDFLELDETLLPSVEMGGEPIQWRKHQLYLGGGDGPLGNLGVGAVTSGRVAVSLGTSGAVREACSQNKPVPSALFRYSVNRELSVLGGAISNGTSVLDWLQKQTSWSFQETLTKIESSSSDGLLVYPYFSGERAPFWRADVSSHISGWSFQHDFGSLARATVEGVTFCLRRLLELLTPSDQPLRCTGGFFASEFLCQLLADVTNRPVAISPVEEATALGAALMACDAYLERSKALPCGRCWEPVPGNQRVYDSLFCRWLDGDPELESNL